MALVVKHNTVATGVRSLNIAATQNGRDRATCILQNKTGVIVVDIDDELEVIEDGTTTFGGSIKVPELAGIGDSSVATEAMVSTLDYNEFGDRQIIINLTIPSGTSLLDAATELLAYLDASVTVNPTQPAWTTTEDITFSEVTVDTALQELSTRSGYLVEINYSKVLSFFAIGSRTAPWNVSNSDTDAMNVRVSKSRLDYYNQCILKFSAAARSAYAFFGVTGNFSNAETVTVGKTYTFQTVLTDVDGNVKIGATAADSLNNLINAIILGGTPGTDYATSMTVNAAVGALLQSTDVMKAVALTAGASGNSVAVAETAANASWFSEGSVPTAVLTYGSDISLTNIAIRDNAVEQASVGIYARLVEAPSVFDLASANSLADALLAIAETTPKTVTYDTYRKGLFPGMTQTIVRTNRDLNDTFLITDVNTRMLEGGALMLRSVTALSGSTFKSSPWRDQYKKWSGTGGASTAVSAGGGGGGTVVGQVVYPLQTTPNLSAQGTGGTWWAADGLVAGLGGLQVYLDPTELGTSLGTVFLRVKAASGSVTARLRNLALGANSGISAATTSATFTTISFPVTIASAGWHELQVSPSVTGIAGRVTVVGYFKPS